MYKDTPYRKNWKEAAELLTSLNANKISVSQLAAFLAFNGGTIEFLNRDIDKAKELFKDVEKWVNSERSKAREEVINVIRRLNQSERNCIYEEDREESITAAARIAARIGGVERRAMPARAAADAASSIEERRELAGVGVDAGGDAASSGELAAGRRYVSKEELKAVMCESEEEYWQMVEEWVERMKTDNVERRAMPARAAAASSIEERRELAGVGVDAGGDAASSGELARKTA